MQQTTTETRQDALADPAFPTNTAKDEGGQQMLLNEIASFFLVTGSPLFLAFYQIAYQDFDASLEFAARSLMEEGPVLFFAERTPRPTASTIAVYLGYVGWQAMLYNFLPGPLHAAPRTVGGRRILYRLNGLAAWASTILVAAACSYLSLSDPTYIANNWGPLLATANVYSMALITISWLKARISPDLESETFLTGYFWYDLFNGGELHPRSGRLFDWKHFNASRTGGILTWSLIDLSFAALQYEKHGKLTASMALTVAFRLTITIEYFWYENWFFETLDGSYERFSFYSIYGFAAMMPHLWTLQTQYLALHPVELSTGQCLGLSMMFLAGWYMRHIVDHQKSSTRAANGDNKIWGETAKVLRVQYRTSDGKVHHSLLLCSGFWGWARHANYLGSSIYTWASCLACGTGHFFPYAEAVLMTIMVVHRCFRDEDRCRAKYACAWDEYCQAVKWRIVPFVF
ncbi:hypothetical protein CKM354_000285200 [Cercospora kikuchii]|uniref:7-dehydrocholesterol reductase n=1 Tax=Cercospora kikuchii TaxID=84275 RepID=A0A9P3CFH9_9PEZI|nr:uncharacterized protein CKM354_000285200 [Cercospora kikuchii]GIZ39470.1 hypothetical protein CKM354_000285200 [Cercospora kikuchii]